LYPVKNNFEVNIGSETELNLKTTIQKKSKASLYNFKSSPKHFHKNWRALLATIFCLASPVTGLTSTGMLSTEGYGSNIAVLIGIFRQ